MQGTPGTLSGEDRQPLHRHLHLSSANTDLMALRYLNICSLLGRKHY